MSTIVERVGSKIREVEESLLNRLVEPNKERWNINRTAQYTEDLIREARRIFVEQLHLYDEGYAKFQLRPPYRLENLPEAVKQYLFPDNPECNEPIEIEAEAYGQDTNRTTVLKMETSRVRQIIIRTDTAPYGYITPPYPRSLYVTDPNNQNPFKGLSKLSEMTHSSTEFILGELHKLQTPPQPTV